MISAEFPNGSRGTLEFVQELLCSRFLLNNSSLFSCCVLSQGNRVARLLKTSMITEMQQGSGEIASDKDLESFIRKNNEITNDFVENYLELFLLSLEDDPTIAEEIKRKHFAPGASISYIDEARPDVITVEYPDGRTEFLPLQNQDK